ncbi:hypothetical protein [Acinetobacter junii]|jgi:hypothetical protein|uniref:Nucleotidyltransferase n=1 Tax=Acinetobacter junii TaxID=40215 RepID=A0ABU8ZKM3_ACIJU
MNQENVTKSRSNLEKINTAKRKLNLLIKELKKDEISEEFLIPTLTFMVLQHYRLKGIKELRLLDPSSYELDVDFTEYSDIKEISESIKETLKENLKYYLIEDAYLRVIEKISQTPIGKEHTQLSEKRFFLKETKEILQSYEFLEKISYIKIDYLKEVKKVIANTIYANDSYETKSLYTNALQDLESLCLFYIIKQERNKLDHTISLIKELLNTFSDEKIVKDPKKYFEWLIQSQNSKFEIFKKTIDYINQNPKCKQKNIYNKLSIDGRECSPMIDLAEQCKILNREREKDTWLLSIN